MPHPILSLDFSQQKDKFLQIKVIHILDILKCVPLIIQVIIYFSSEAKEKAYS